MRRESLCEQEKAIFINRSKSDLHTLNQEEELDRLKMNELIKSKAELLETKKSIKIKPQNKVNQKILSIQNHFAQLPSKIDRAQQLDLIND